MKKNGLFAFALGFIFLAGTFVGCGTNTVGEPDYSDTDLKFHIGAWIAPPPAIEATGYIN